MAEGTVRWFNEVEGYGFIRPDGSRREVLVERADIHSNGYVNLEAGDRVSFAVHVRAGQARAVKVTPLGTRVPPPDASHVSSARSPTPSTAREVVGGVLALLLLAGAVTLVVLAARTSW